MRMKISLLAAALSFTLIAAGCASKPAGFTDIDAGIDSGDFDRALAVIEKGQASKKPVYDVKKNGILLALDEGLLKHYAGRYADSAQDLEDAEQQIEAAYTKSVTAEAASYIVNDNTKEYPGEDFEDIYINIFNALNYYHQNDIEGALVEVRKLLDDSQSGKLVMLDEKYAAGTSRAASWFKSSLDSTLNVDMPSGEPVNWSNSALAQYLGALFYRAGGNDDSVRICLERLEKAYTDFPNIYGTGGVPRSVADEREIPAGKARLNVIAFSGLSPVKVEKVYSQYLFFLSRFELQNASFKLPAFENRPSAITGVTISISNGEILPLEQIEDMGAVVKETYNAKFAATFLKTYIRTLIKYIAANVSAVEGKRLAIDRGMPEALAELTALAGTIAVKKAVEASESADIRMGRFFPSKAYIGGITLDPGVYTITVNFSCGITRTFPDIKVQSGKLNLIEAVCLK